MIRSPFHCLALLALLALAPLSAAQPGAPEPDKLLRLLPPGAISMTRIASVPEFLSAFHSTPFRGIYADAEFRTFLAPVVDALEMNNPELGMAVRAGEVAPSTLFAGAFIAAEYPDARPERDGRARVNLYQAPPGGGPALLDRLLASARIPGSRLERSAEPIAGHPVVVLQSLRMVREKIRLEGKARKYKKELLESRGLSEDDLDPGAIATRREIAEEFYFSAPDFVLHCTGGRALVEQILSRVGAADGMSSLATEPKWLGPRGTMHSRPALEFYRDLYPADARGRRDIDDDDYRLGLNEFRSVAGGFSLLPDRLALEIAVYVPEPRLGLGKLLFINDPLEPPRASGAGLFGLRHRPRDATGLIPPDSVAYSAYSADFARLWTEAYQILQKGAPDLAEILDAYFQTQPGGGREGNFSTRFAPNFGSRWITFSRPPTKEPTASDRPELTVMIELRDAAALAPVLDAWLQNLGQLLNLRMEQFTVRGRKFYRIEGAEGLDSSLSPLGPLAYVCLSERWLLFSQRQEHILAALSALGPSERARPGSPAGDGPLLRDPGYLELHTSLPRDRFFEAYALPDAMDQMMGSPLIALLSEGFGGAVDSLVDLDDTPREDIWRSRFGASGFSLRTSGSALVADLQFIYPPAPAGTAP